MSDWTTIPIDRTTKRPAVTWAWRAAGESAPVGANQDTGVLTGARSGVVVLDLDVKNGVDGCRALAKALRVDVGEAAGLDALKILFERDALPMAPVARTRSGGFHLYFAAPDRPVKNSVGQIASGVDVRGDGGYAKCVPSEGYSWIVECEPAPCPQWFLDHPATTKKVRPPAAAGGVAPSTERAKRALEAAVGRIRGATEGGNEKLNREAYTIGGYVGAGSIAFATAHAAFADAIAGWDDLDRHLGTLESALAAGECCPFADPEDAFERGDHVELATRMLDHVGQGRGELVADEGQLWAYSDAIGIFETIDAAEQSRVVQGFAGRFVRKGDKLRTLDIGASDVVGAIRLARDQVGEPGFFAGAPDGLVFADHFVALSPEGIEVRAHAREHRARAGYPFSLDLEAHPALFVGSLTRLWSGDSDAAEKIAFIQEFVGACIFGIAPRFQRAVIMHDDAGNGETGKSHVAEVAMGVMPDGTTSAIPPHLFGSEYRRAQLRGVRLNAVNELPSTDIADTEAFKAVITGDPVDSRVIREQPFPLRAIAGHLFSANALPGSVEVGNAFFRRFVYLGCNNKVTDAERVHDYHRIVLEKEKPAIVAWAVQGAARLLARGRYVIPPSSDAKINDWRRKAESVGHWLADATRPDEKGTPAALLYGAYRRWAEQSGFKPVSIVKWGQRLKALETPWTKLPSGIVYRIAPDDRNDKLAGEIARRGLRSVGS